MVTTSFDITSEQDLVSDLASIDVGGINGVNANYTFTLEASVTLTADPLPLINLVSGASLTIQGNSFVLSGGGAGLGADVFV